MCSCPSGTDLTAVAVRDLGAYFFLSLHLYLHVHGVFARVACAPSVCERRRLHCVGRALVEVAGAIQCEDTGPGDWGSQNPHTHSLSTKRPYL